MLSGRLKETVVLRIYEDKGHWYAKGRSAQFIRLLQKQYTKTKLFVHSTRNWLVDRVELDLTTMLEHFRAVKCSDNEILLAVAR